MAKKNTKIVFDSPVTLILAACCLLVFAFCKIAPQAICAKVMAFFSTPVMRQNGKVVNLFNVSTYLRLVMHVFGHGNFFSLFLNLSFILLLAPQTEKLYGSRFFALMALTASLVSGVLAFCFVPFSLQGAQCISFLLVVLCVFGSIKKQELPLSPLILLVLFIIFSITANYGAYAQIANLAGGLCAALFGMIPQEKKNTQNGKKSSAGKNKENKTGTEANDE